MRTASEIRNDALECLRLAQEAKARGHKAALMIMAHGWALLAEQADAVRAASGDADQEVEPA
ncbi:MAG: hypothetical protein HY056_16290 [Proteobacteria bacterium]|nr:hypothetical protein [Pseudomonadota bacterium]